MPSIRLGLISTTPRLRSGQSTPSPSPPVSPKHSPRAHYARSKSGRMQNNPPLTPPPRTFLQYFFCVVLSVLLRRHKVLLLAPVIYISGMILYMGTVSLDLPREKKPDPPGSIYRSPQVFENLWPAMQMANSSVGVATTWGHPYEGEAWLPCLDHKRNDSQGLSNSNGYIIIEANGGLNQQRLSICNAVAVASLLNATLVVPAFHLNSVWQDSSKFGEIYDEDHFIESLSSYVRVVKKLPDDIMEKFGNVSNMYNFRIKALSPTSFYLEVVLPKLIETGVIRISPFANRLSFDKIPLEIQRLRCRTNFEALRFAPSIFKTGNTLVQRMLELSPNADGKYVAVHLRFEEDMVAFSCCIYDGGEAEKREMDDARERGWRGKFKKPGRIIKPGAFRMDGKCPLTPLEVGMMLRGMGFRNDTPIYLAAGKIYQEEKNMIPLRQMFPRLQTKETLLSLNELEPFKNHSSRLAALDYTVCLHSEVFVSTQGGNFPHFLIGHRRFLNKGYAKTVRPDKRKLALLLDNPNIRWESFSRQMQAMRRHNDIKGHESRKPSASIYTYPAPDCMCLENASLQQTGSPVNASIGDWNPVAIST